VVLENRVLSYAATGEDENGEKKELKDFIHSVDNQLMTLHRLPFEFEPEAIPQTADVLKEASQTNQ